MPFELLKILATVLVVAQEALATANELATTLSKEDVSDDELNALRAKSKDDLAALRAKLDAL